MADVVEIEDGAHSILGPSAAERWINCPGSVLATKDVPDRPSQYAIEGTAAHTVSEWARVLEVPVSTFKGITVRVKHALGHADVYCGKPMVEGVQTFIDAVAKQPGEKLIEARVSYSELIPGGFGTLDAGALAALIAVITDLKYGKGVKKVAAWNPQLLLYAYGVWLKWDWLFDFQKFVLIISQPRLNFHDEWEITIGELLRWVYDVARPASRIAMKPGAPFKAGDWCKFCRIRDTCRTRAAYESEHAAPSSRRGGDFESLD